MVLDRWLSEALAHQLSTFLVVNLNALRVSLLQGRVELSDVDIRVESINSYLVSLPVILKRGSIGGLVLQLKPLLVDAINLQLENLHLFLEPRAQDSPWWTEQASKSEEKLRSGRLTALDPEGAAVHTAVEAMEEKTNASMAARIGDAATTRITDAILALLQVEIRNATVHLLAHSAGYLRVDVCAGVTSVSLKRGWFSSANQQSGLSRTVGVLSNSPTDNQVKCIDMLCNIVGLYTWLETEGEASTNSHRSHTSMESLQEKEGMSDLNDQQNVENQTLNSSGGQRRHLLLPSDLRLQLQLRHGGLQGLEADIMGVCVELETADISPLLAVASAMQGPGPPNCSCSSGDVVEEAHPYAPLSNECAKDADVDAIANSLFKDGGSNALTFTKAGKLWRKATALILRRSSRQRLEHALKAGTARHHYAVLYEDWLRMQHWGTTQASTWRSRGVNTSSSSRRSGSSLKAELAEAETKIPLEAVALARRIARRKVRGPEGSEGNTRSGLFMGVHTAEQWGTNRNSMYTVQSRHGSFMLAPSLLSKASPRTDNAVNFKTVESSSAGKSGLPVVCLSWIGFSFACQVGDQGRLVEVECSHVQGDVSFASVQSTTTVQTDNVPDYQENHDEEGSSENEEVFEDADAESVSQENVWHRWSGPLSSPEILLRSNAVSNRLLLTSKSDVAPVLVRPGFKTFPDPKGRAMPSSSVWRRWLPWRLLSAGKSSKQEENGGQSQEPQRKQLFGENMSQGNGEMARGRGRPFLLLELGSPADGLSGGLSSGLLACALAMGRLDASFPSDLPHTLGPLVKDLSYVLGTQAIKGVGEELKHASSSDFSSQHLLNKRRPENDQSQAEEQAVSLREVANNLKSISLSILRQTLLGIGPLLSLQGSLAIEGPRIILHSPLHSTSSFSNSPISHHRREPEGLRLELNLGDLELTACPIQPPTKLSSSLNNQSQESACLPSFSFLKNDFEGPAQNTGNWKEAVKRAAWERRPPRPAIPGADVRGLYLEHRERWTGLALSVTNAGLLLVHGGHSEALVEPASLNIHSSIHMDYWSSLFGTGSSTSAAMVVDVPYLGLKLTPEAVAGISQLLSTFQEMSASAFGSETLEKAAPSCSGERENASSTSVPQFSPSPETGPSLSTVAVAVGARVGTLKLVCNWLVAMPSQETRSSEEAPNLQNNKVEREQRMSRSKSTDSRRQHGGHAMKGSAFKYTHRQRVEAMVKGFTSDILVGDGSSTDVRVGLSLLRFTAGEVPSDGSQNLSSRAVCLLPGCVLQVIACEDGNPDETIAYEREDTWSLRRLLQSDAEEQFSFRRGCSSPESLPTLEERLQSWKQAKDWGLNQGCPTEILFNTVYVQPRDSQSGSSDLLQQLPMGSACFLQVAPLVVVSLDSASGESASDHLRSWGDDLIFCVGVTPDFDYVSAAMEGGQFSIETTALAHLLASLELCGSSLLAIENMSSSAERSAVAEQRLPEAKSACAWEGSASMQLKGFSLLLTNGQPERSSTEGILLQVDAATRLFAKNSNMSVSFTLGPISIKSVRPELAISARQSSSSDNQPSEDGLSTESGQRSRSWIGRTTSEIRRCSSQQQRSPLFQEDDCLLKDLQACILLETFHSTAEEAAKTWAGAWQGQMEMKGLDVAITISEIKLLLALAAPFSSASPPSSTTSPEVSSQERHSQPREHMEPARETTRWEQGTVVAIKDMSERQFLTVQEVGEAQGMYRLVGSTHYSLSQDGSLFKVDYPKGEKTSSRFNLLSLHGRSPTGEALRLQFEPRSGQVQVSAAKKGACDLWQLQLHKALGDAGEAEYLSEDGDLSLYDCKHGPRYQLVNEKSGRYLNFVDGIPILTKQPIHALKVHILAAPFPSTAGQNSQGLLKHPSGSRTLSRGGPAGNAPSLHQQIDGVEEGEGEGESMGMEQVARAVANVPAVRLLMNKARIIVLYDAASGLHMLPILQVCLEGVEGVAHVGPSKARLLLDCSLAMDYYDASKNQWGKAIKRIPMDLFFRMRFIEKASVLPGFPRPPATFFCNVGKVELLLSEEILDAILFLVGCLELAGPYNVKHSPVLASRCQVSNDTGIDLLCHFNGDNERTAGVVNARSTSQFLIRHKTSRREMQPLQNTSEAVLRLKGTAGAETSPLFLSLAEAGAMAVRTRLLSTGASGDTKVSSGAMLVFDVSQQTSEGMRMSVSPLLVLRNDSGLPLELRLRRPMQQGAAEQEGGESNVIQIPDGGVFDDAMVAFESMALSGERRKIVAALTIGNYLLSIRPKFSDINHDSFPGSFSLKWSEDVAGGRPIRVLGWMEKLQRSFRQTMGEVFGRSLESSFCSLLCEFEKQQAANPSESVLMGATMNSKLDQESVDYDSLERKTRANIKGLHFLVRCTKREIPIRSVGKDGHVKRYAQEQTAEGGRKERVHVWIAQRELVFLPTLRVRNLLPFAVFVAVGSNPDRIFHSISTTEWEESAKVGSTISKVRQGGKQACLHADPSLQFLVVHDPSRNLTSSAACLEAGSSQGGANETTVVAKSGPARELTVSFAEDRSVLQLLTSSGEDGVPLVTLFSKYELRNDTSERLLCSKGIRRQQGGRKKGGRGTVEQLEWPADNSEGLVIDIPPGGSIPWLQSSGVLLLKGAEDCSPAIPLDLDSLSGSTEITLSSRCHSGGNQLLPLGIKINLPMAENPTRVVGLSHRFLIENRTPHSILICQDGLQGAADAWQRVVPGERVPLHLQSFPRGSPTAISAPSLLQDPEESSSTHLQLSVRVQPVEDARSRKWDWSGPICPASLGCFSLKVRASAGEGSSGDENAQQPMTARGDGRQNVEGARGRGRDMGDGRGSMARSMTMSKGVGGVRAIRFLQAEVSDEPPSLVMCLKLLEAEAVPYRIENRLSSSSISFCQKGLEEMEVLEPGGSIGYVWDDLNLPRKLLVSVAGSQAQQEVSLDKIRPWKVLRSRRNPLLRFDFPFGGHPDVEEGEGGRSYGERGPLGLEIYGEGPTRVVRVCPAGEQRSEWGIMGGRGPVLEADVRLPLITLTALETVKQSQETPEKLPFLYIRVTGTTFELDLTEDSLSFELKVQTTDMDAKWKGAPFVALLRPARESEKGGNVLHSALVLNRRSSDPRHLRYVSILLQELELNLDEDTLMKIVPFTRLRATPYTYPPTSPIYFERFEIHPIKVKASFQPGAAQGDYSSAQEALRALLHSVIQVPAVKGMVVELNGVLLTHALLSYTQLALKCAQHYSWYGMRAVYVARGSKLLPPSFISLFDDSAASSIDVFFDPSNGSIDAMGLTFSMFSLLRKGLQRRGGKGGTLRYLGEIKNTMREAGSNLMYAVVTEVSDSMLKGVETGGVDGLFNGLRRGIFNVALKPSMLRGAVVRGGATRRFHLDRSIGTDDVYVEGYLQAMVDALFKQDYLRVKVSNDEVVLKNLPPNTALSSEIVSTVKQFLVAEGLISGQTSAAGVRSLRRLRGETERQVGPAVRALLEQLAVLVIIRAMRQQVRKLLHLEDSKQPSPELSPTTAGENERLEERAKQNRQVKPIGRRNIWTIVGHVILSSIVAFLDGRLCRQIPNPFVRRVVSGFLLSFMEL